MADEDLELDLGDGGGDEAGGGGKKKLIIIILAAVLLLGGGAAAFLLMGGDDKEKMAKDGTMEKSMDSEEMAVDETITGPIFTTLKPTLTVNFPGRKTRYLQLSLSMMAKKQTVIDAIVHHSPVISNNLLLIIGSQSVAKLRTTKGKKKLRELLLTEVRKVIKENSKLEGVENVYFTRFVMQ